MNTITFEELEQLDLSQITVVDVRKKEDFVGNFTHEIKTPMTSIIGYSDLLRTYDLEPDKRREYSNFIYRESKRLETLSINLLQLIVIGKKEFAEMKPTAYLINTARGNILNEADLIEAVEKKEIAGATVDVISVEPPKGDEDIWKCSDIIVTPHISYISEESFHTLKVRTVENAYKMFNGERPDDLVNG